MHCANLRRVGGSVMLAVPPALLEILNLTPGAQVGITLEDGRLIVAPLGRPRYALDALLDEAERSGAYPLADAQREWVDAAPVGRELI